MTVKILRPSVDDFGQTMVLRGLLDCGSLGDLRCDFYQREKLPESSRRDIWCALANGIPLPDVEIGMRGMGTQAAEGQPLDQIIELLDPCYIIDGRQRIETLRDYLRELPESKIMLGVTVHFNTTPEWERARFHKLNTSRVKVAPSVLLRNIKDDSIGLASLYGLSRSQVDFPLYRRVCWTQNMANSELMTGLTYVRTILRMHAHLAPTRTSMTPVRIPKVIDRVVGRVGLALWRQNVITFWSIMDDLWGIKGVTGRGHACYLLTNFLSVFADVLSDHIDFWRQPEEMKLFLPDELRSKLRKFPVNDPEVMRLAGSSGKARETLYFILVQHINSGKRTKRLVPRNVRATVPPMFDDDDDDDEPERGTAA